MKSYLLIAIALSNLMTPAKTETRNISGSVHSNYNKQILPGVHIKQLNTNRETYTDGLGHYHIAVTGAHAQLVFSLTGYKADTVMVGNSDILNLNLTPLLYFATDSLTYKAQLHEITANQRVIKKYFRGSRDQITPTPVRIGSHEVQDNPVGNVDQLLQGKVEDLSFQNSTGAPGLRANVNTRNLMYSRLNGKDFAGGSAKQAAKNLPADIIKKIQIINDYGEQLQRAAPTNESYSQINENQFLDPHETPLSTFATDVDAASYANVRRFINSGNLPPKDAVRIEEMINYFKYNLPKPDHGAPVAIQTELATAPWNAKHQLVKISLKAKEVDADKLPPSNLVFLIDVSGSMLEPNKLPLVKTSLKMLVDQLRPIDNVAIVTYAGYVSVPLESTKADDKQKIKDAIDGLGAGGSTAGAAGILTAYKIAKEKFIKHGNNRIILATDGDFNVGPSSDKDMQQIIEGESQSKISLSILGFGMGNYKDSKMELLADKGHGNYAYIDNITEASKSMVHEFGGTLFTVAKDVKLQVEFNPAKVQAYRLLGYEDRLMAKEDFNNDNKMGGDMGVGHTVTALYELIPVGVKDDVFGSVDPLKYQKPAENKPINNSPELMTVKFRYKEPDGDVSKMESVTVSGDALKTEKASDDFKFAAAVAEFGLLLRDSQYKQKANYGQVIALAKSAKGKDDDGYRAEFIRLAESAMNMAKSSVVSAAR